MGKIKKTTYIFPWLLRAQVLNDLLPLQIGSFLLDRYLKKWFLVVLRPLAHLFIRLGFRPDWLTLMGLVMNVGATAAFAKGYLQLGALIMMVAGLCDILDGQVAREGHKETKFGALLDSTQ